MASPMSVHVVWIVSVEYAVLLWPEDRPLSITLHAPWLSCHSAKRCIGSQPLVPYLASMTALVNHPDIQPLFTSDWDFPNMISALSTWGGEELIS
eukprot:3963125-Karenia_brevis.AAC.1